MQLCTAHAICSSGFCGSSTSTVHVAFCIISPLLMPYGLELVIEVEMNAIQILHISSESDNYFDCTCTMT